MQLGFGRSKFRFAARPATVARSPTCRAAGSPRPTPGSCAASWTSRALDAEVIRLDGAVETSIQLGVADVIADVVETGSTLRQAGLEIFGNLIMESEAVLVSRSEEVSPPGLEIFVRRLQGVMVARSYVMMDYDIPADRVEEAVALTPGIESPTVSPAASGGLGRGPLDGAACGRPAGDGRALRARSAGHPDHRHPRVPAVTRIRRHDPDPAASPRGPGGRLHAGVLLPVLLVVMGIALPPSVRAKFDWIQIGTLLLFALVVVVFAWALMRCRVDLTSEGLAVVNGFTRHEYAWPQVVAMTMAPGHPWAVLDLTDGTSVSAVGIQAADGARATAQVRQVRDHIRRYGTPPGDDPAGGPGAG